MLSPFLLYTNSARFRTFSYRFSAYGHLIVTKYFDFLKLFFTNCCILSFVIFLFSTVIEEKNERKAFEIGPNAHFYLDENVVWDLHFIIFFDICSMFLVNSISCQCPICRSLNSVLPCMRIPGIKERAYAYIRSALSSLHDLDDLLLCYVRSAVPSVLTGVRQLKIHKSSKSGLVAAFFVSSP